MKQPLCFDIGFVCIRLSLEVAQAFLSAIHFYERPPCLALGVPSGSEKIPVLLVRLWSAYVLQIDQSRCIAQVRPAVVVSTAIQVINICLWILSSHPHPGQSVCRMGPVVDVDKAIAVLLAECAGNLTSFNVPTTPAPTVAIDPPSNDSRLWVVIQQFSDPLCPLGLTGVIDTLGVADLFFEHLFHLKTSWLGVWCRPRPAVCPSSRP